MRKVDLVRAIQWEHPTVTLDIGTVSGNVKRALQDEPDFAPEVFRCLGECVCLAANTKRSCQQLVGRLIERVAAPLGYQTENCLTIFVRVS